MTITQTHLPEPKQATTVEHVLTLDCPEAPGIVHAVSSFLFEHGCDIIDNKQFGERSEGHFFMRVHFASDGDETTADTLREAFAPVADKFGMRWQLEPHGAKRKVLIMVSKFGHCLNDLLFRARIGELPMEWSPWCPTTRTTRHWWNGTASRSIHVPVTPETKPAAEARLLELVDELDVELVVLARYMQVLSDELTRQAGRPGHQHPPLLPAQLQGRQAVPPGLRPRRQDRRRHGPLRQRGAGRGTDHRPAGGGSGPHLRARRPGGRRTRHRMQGALQRRPLALRGQGHPAGKPHRGASVGMPPGLTLRGHHPKTATSGIDTGFSAYRYRRSSLWALWLTADGTYTRTIYEAALGCQAWAEPQEPSDTSTYRLTLAGGQHLKERHGTAVGNCWLGGCRCDTQCVSCCLHELVKGRQGFPDGKPPRRLCLYRQWRIPPSVAISGHKYRVVPHLRHCASSHAFSEPAA